MSAFNLAAMLAHHADRFPDRPCLVWGDEVVSYAGLETRAARAGAERREVRQAKAFLGSK